MSQNNRTAKVPSPSVNDISMPVGGDATHPPVNDNPGEAPQVQMIADAKAIQEQELASNEEASLKAEMKDLKGTVVIPASKTEDGEEIKEVKATPMMVVATRAGFFKQSRKQEGDKFVIAGPHELGDWMKKI